jgi:hypothetical protein
MAEIARVAHPVERGACHLSSFGPRGPSHVIPNLQAPCFGEKLSWYFFSILFPAKTDRNKTFAKNNIRFNNFTQVWRDSGANYREKYL